ANKLDTESVDNDGLIEVLGGGALTIVASGTVDNTGGQVTVDALGTLTVDHSTIDKGAIGRAPSRTGVGTLDLLGTVQQSNGTFTVISTAVPSNGPLCMDCTSVASGAANKLDTESVDNDGLIEVLGGGALTIVASGTVDNTGGQVTVDALGTLTVDHSTIDKG